jgi:hypothetical protein
MKRVRGTLAKLKSQLPSFRTWVAIGTVTVLIVGGGLIVAAYDGWDVGTGDHDKGVTVTVAVTIAAAVLGAVAAVLALAAYWSASGTADLDVEIRFNFSHVNEPYFKVSEPQGPDGWVPIVPFKQNRATVTLRNDSKYSARNPWVRIRLYGISLPKAPEGWKPTRTANMFGVTELMWEGEIIHGDMPLPLPDLVLEDSLLAPKIRHRIEATLVADGLARKEIEVPVVGLKGDDYAAYRDARKAQRAKLRATFAEIARRRKASTRS